MKIFRGLPSVPHRAPCALTIGNFDWVHLGHQALLKQLCLAAHTHQLHACVLTFEPHPREFFSPNAAPPRIYGLRDKIEALRAAKIDRVIIARFDARFAVQTPHEFIRDVLVQRINTRYLLIGDDFRFGAGGSGDFATLQKEGEERGFETARVNAVQFANRRVSSSAIRVALRAGDLTHAARLLGRPYIISGHVLHGAKLGQQLGFPTINLRVGPRSDKIYAALTGIFIAQVHGIAPHPLPAVASLGVRPTVDGPGHELLEAHLLDFDQPLYGKLVHIEFLKKLRDEIKYASLDALRQAIAEDTAQARHWFSQAHVTHS
ncbi:MAG: bifunctional riboflavin kinase/FAD synthetase [Ottowia sp.]|nr:bifunctional riboflavin kinase/FAD synthetase [Ottowia sp.]